jgi:hypothetical protein
MGPGKKKKRPKSHHYTEEDLQNCLHALRSRNSKLKLKEAARQFGVPPSTVRDRLHMRSDPASKRGPRKTLSDTEELSLATYARHMCEIGLGLTTIMLCSLALQLIQERIPSRKQPPKKDWARKFLKRHQLSYRKCSTVSKQRISNSSVLVINNYFKKLKTLYDKHNLHIRPEAIWNMDETYLGIKQEGLNRKTIGKKGTSRPLQQQVFTADHTTVASCISAAGQFMPNLLIYSKSLPTERYTDFIPKSWSLTCTDTGYINTKIFEQWLENVFIPNCGCSPSKPVLLIMDNCSTHYSIKVINAAKENNIHIMCEPPHTSHLLQPLDKIFFNLKDEFSKRCYAAKVVDLNSTVNKGNMALKLRDAQEHAWSIGVVKSAFRRVGIYPLDRTRIPDS